MSNQDEDIFAAENRVESGRIQWGKIGDSVKGTLVGSKDVTFSDGKVNKVFELLVIEGQYHPIVEDAEGNEVASENPIVLEAGDFIRIPGKAGVTDEMKKIKIGQNVGLRYEALGDKKPGKKRFKDVKVYQGKMNEEYLATVSADTSGLPPFGQE